MRYPLHSLLTLPYLSCFDGDADPANDPASDPANDPANENKTFTQDDMNRFLADDRRKHQAKLKDMETRLESVLKSKGLSEQEREGLETSLEDMRKQLRTKEEQIAHEKKRLETQYQTQLKEKSESETKWKSMFHDSTISRALQDAAVKGEAFNANQIVTLLRSNTKLSEGDDGSHKVVVEFNDVNDKGEQVALTLTPDEAVERMREKPDTFGNLFKSNVVSGIGGNSTTGGVTPGKHGKIDPRKLDPETYRKLRKENPESLGLRR